MKYQQWIWRVTGLQRKRAGAASAPNAIGDGSVPGAWPNRRPRCFKAQYGVEQVSVFGSLTHPDRFTEWSDVDLAAWGLTTANWLKASAAVRALASDIELNVVDVSVCSSELLAAIAREGVPL